MKRILSVIAIIALCFSCDMEESPKDSVDKAAIFSSEAGLKTYAYSFYNMLPSASEFNVSETEMADYGAINSMDYFIQKNSYSEEVSDGWDWEELRNVNYFIENCTSEKLSESVRNNYLGIARLFRAYFYYDKVTRFGDVPWIDRTLTIDDDLLYAPRDSRELVMEKVYEDLEFACNNITETSDATGSLITKWVAYAFASRVALFEASFRKYHNLQLATSAETWYNRVIEKSEYLMNNSGKHLYTAEGVNKSYRSLFISDNPHVEEVLLASCSSTELAILHNANWKWTSPTYGNRFSMIRPFINTYLQLDGTPYTQRKGWETETFYEECQNRDARLAQTIRTPGYSRADGTPAPPDFFGYSFTGYQPLKFCLDDSEYDNRDLNTNAMPLFRYAEVLLNYAEAKAELGEMTDEIWSKTIGAIRARSGITGGIDAMPTQVDQYFQQTYFPSISDATILEVRRERAIEMSLEGLRFNDLLRWKAGDLLKMSWEGMYIPSINTAFDLDHNGTYDAIFYDTDENLEKAKSSIDWDTAKSTCAPVKIAGGDNQLMLVKEVEDGNASAGYYLTWDVPNDSKRVWGNKQYFYPIPVMAIVRNSNLTQNAGWENGATNDGN